MLNRPEDAKVLSYPTGEAIKPGDHVIFDRAAAQVELVVVAPGVASTQPYWEEFGPGILVGGCVELGRVYVPLPQELTRLASVARRNPR